MSKELKDWIDAFVKNGANPKNVPNWPEEAGGGSGTKVVTELPQVGEEHTIYELQEKKIIPSLIPIVNQQMVNDGVLNELVLFTFVFDTHDEMVNTITPLIPNEEILFRVNYIIKEDKLIMSIYGGTEWQFVEATKVSDYKFDLSNAFGSEEPMYVVMLKEYLGKTSEESGDIRYTGKLLNDELYTFGANTFCIVLGAPTIGIMTNNACMQGSEIPEDTPKELIFEYIPYEKIIKELSMQWVFKPNGIGEVTVSSYWIYTNETWFNADEIREFESQEKTVSPSTNTQQITPDKGYDGLSKVTVNAMNLQYKTVDPTTYTQFIIRDAGFDGLAQVTVNPIQLQSKTVIPTTSKQYVRPDANYNGLSQVTVEATSTLTLQEKTVSPTTSKQEITPDEGYGGLGKVTINAVTNTIDSNIRSENIKKGVRILGVSGNCDCVTYKTTELSTTLPQALSSIGVATVGSYVYLFGGTKSGSSFSNTIYKFNTETRTESIAEFSTTLPQALGYMGVAQVGSNIYLFGGTKSDLDFVNTIYKFNTKTESIAELSTTLPQALSAIGVTTVGSYVYLFGGVKTDRNFSNTIYKFNTETETISTLSVTLPQALSNIGVAQVGSNIYLIGGAKHTGDSGILNTIYKFNTETETIVTVSTTLPQALKNIGVATFGSNIYLFEGIKTDRDFSNTIYKFNTKTETISTLSTTLPQALGYMGVAQVGSDVYLFGGIKSSSHGSVNTIYKFKIDF